jgi:hypothetical protein
VHTNIEREMDAEADNTPACLPEYARALKKHCRKLLVGQGQGHTWCGNRRATYTAALKIVNAWRHHQGAPQDVDLVEPLPASWVSRSPLYQHAFVVYEARTIRADQEHDDAKAHIAMMGALCQRPLEGRAMEQRGDQVQMFEIRLNQNEKQVLRWNFQVHGRVNGHPQMSGWMRRCWITGARRWTAGRSQGQGPFPLNTVFSRVYT